jgi:hypothetical protein
LPDSHHWGLFVLNNAEIDVALTDVAIVFGLIGGGLAMAPKMSIRRPTAAIT